MGCQTVFLQQEAKQKGHINVLKIRSQWSQYHENSADINITSKVRHNNTGLQTKVSLLLLSAVTVLL